MFIMIWMAFRNRGNKWVLHMAHYAARHGAQSATPSISFATLCLVLKKKLSFGKRKRNWYCFSLQLVFCSLFLSTVWLFVRKIILRIAVDAETSLIFTLKESSEIRVMRLHLFVFCHHDNNHKNGPLFTMLEQSDLLYRILNKLPPTSFALFIALHYLQLDSVERMIVWVRDCVRVLCISSTYIS